MKIALTNYLKQENEAFHQIVEEFGIPFIKGPKFLVVRNFLTDRLIMKTFVTPFALQEWAEQAVDNSKVTHVVPSLYVGPEFGSENLRKYAELYNDGKVIQEYLALIEQQLTLQKALFRGIEEEIKDIGVK